MLNTNGATEQQMKYLNSLLNQQRAYIDTVYANAPTYEREQQRQDYAPLTAFWATVTFGSLTSSQASALIDILRAPGAFENAAYSIMDRGLLPLCGVAAEAYVASLIGQ